MHGIPIARNLSEKEVFDWAVRHNQNDDFSIAHFKHAKDFSFSTGENPPSDFVPGYAVQRSEKWEFGVSLSSLLLHDFVLLEP